LPKQTVTGIATIKSCEMNVPTKMVFDLGGQRRECSGVWKGVAVSKAHYHVQQSLKPHNLE